MKSTKTILFLIFFGLITIAAFYNRIKYKSEEELLFQNHELTLGYITYFGHSTGGATAPPEYSFKVKDREFVDKFSKSDFCQRPSYRQQLKIQGFQFPIIYLPSDPSKSRILLKKKEFEKYGIQYPDNLKEVLENYFECD